MRPRVRFPALPWGHFLEGEDSHGDHGLGSLGEFRLRPLLVLHIHIYHNPSHRDNVTVPHGRPILKVSYTSATTGRGDHEGH
jgi:hypothetical protein